MEDDFTFNSMINEIKINLSKFESIIKEIESYPSKKKLTEADTIQKKLVQKIKMVKSIIKTEEDNFMLDSYIELNTELNNRLTIAKKRQEKNSQKNKYKDFLNSDKNKNMNNLENITALDDEHESLKNSIKLSTEITQGLKNTNEELENQKKHWMNLLKWL